MRALVAVAVIVGVLATGCFVYLAATAEDATMHAAYLALAGTLAAAVVAALVAIVTAWWTVTRQERKDIIQRRRTQLAAVRRLANRYDRHRTRAHELRTDMDTNDLQPAERSALEALSWRCADAAEEIREDLLNAIDEASALAQQNLKAVLTQIQDQLQQHKGSRSRKRWIPKDKVDPLPIEALRSTIEADLEHTRRRY